MHTKRIQPRILAYDALRAFAILSVVGIHTLMPYRELLPASAPIRVVDDLLHYAVPLFVFISGALVWARPWHGGPGAYRTFLTRRVTLIGVPYLAWSAVFLVLRFATEPTTLAEVPALILSGHTWYHLYFVPMLLTFYLLTPLASRIAGRSPELLVLAAIAIRILPDPPLATYVGSALGDLGWAWATHVVTHLPHMALGAWFAIRYPSWPAWVRQTWPALLGAGILVLAAASLGLHAEWPLLARRLVLPLGMTATVLGFALLAFDIEPTLERFGRQVEQAGALAFGVYFVHPVYLLVVTMAVSANAGVEAWLQPWLPIATYAEVCVASYLSASALAGRDATSWLVGIRRGARDNGSGYAAPGHPAR